MAEFPPDKPEKTVAVEEMKTKKADHAKTIEEEEVRTEEVTEQSMLRTEVVTSGEEEVQTEEVTEHRVDCDTILNLKTENKESSEAGNKKPQEDSINKNPIDGTDSIKKCLEGLFANVENEEEYIQMQLDKANSEIAEIMSQVRGSNRNDETNQMSTDGGSQNTSQQNSLMANQVMPMSPNLEQNYFNHPYGMMYPPQEGFVIQAPMMPMPIQMMYYYPPQEQFLGPESDQLNQMGMVPYFIPYQAPMMYPPHHFISNMAPSGWPGSFVVDQNYYNQAPFPNAAAEAPWPEMNQQRQQRQPQRQHYRRDNGGNSSRQGQYRQQRFRNMAPSGRPRSFVVDRNYYNQQHPQQRQSQRQQPRRDNHGNSSRRGQGQYPQQRPR